MWGSNGECCPDLMLLLHHNLPGLVLFPLVTLRTDCGVGGGGSEQEEGLVRSMLPAGSLFEVHTSDSNRHSRT